MNTTTHFGRGCVTSATSKARTLDIEFRFSEGQEDRLPGLAAELIALNVDVIVSYATGVPAARR